MQTVTTQTVAGQQVIAPSDLVYCNTRYHSPYLAKVAEDGSFAWQEKVYLGYGKHRGTYYVVEELQSGDLIQCAGGSGGNKYPFKGRVVERTETTLTVESIDDQTWSNLIGSRKKSAQKTATAHAPIESPY